VTSSSELAIAVVGMACRFPGARNATEFWRNLQSGTESIRVFADEELQAAGVERRQVERSSYVKARGVLDDVDQFDAAFFNVNPNEAELMDPQHRVFLECAWEALEDAGICPTHYERSIGVYAGAGPESYLLHLHSNKGLVDSIGGFQLSLGNDKDYLTTRVSYKLNLTGPSITVQTACSSSLAAVHLAIQALLAGECDTALAGGVAIRLPQIAGYVYQPDGILSPDGHCRAFDRNAQGTVPGNGVGIVVLRRLSSAIADGNFVHAVIAGSAVANDGSRRVGFTAPAVDGQVKAIRMALAVAGVAPDTIGYIEAHGSGTPLGDRVELEALARAFGACSRAHHRCALGSVKSNVGHLDAAAGVAGLIKTVLAIRHHQIPASLHFVEPNLEVNLSATPFYVSTGLHEWTATEGPLRAGVSSLGIGGTNVHVVVEEAPARVASPRATRRQVWLLSARTNECLDRATERLTGYLRENPEVEDADAAYTLQVGRAHFPWRRVLVAKDTADARCALESRDPLRVSTERQANADRAVAFLFPAEGVGLTTCQDLARREPELQPHIQRCGHLFRGHLGIDLLDVAVGVPVDETVELAALFSVEYALAQVWQAWGVQPQVVYGCGVGAYAAAFIAGRFELDAAVALVACRDRDEIVTRLRAVELVPPAIPVLSSLTSTWLTPANATDPTHWLAERHRTRVDADLVRVLAGGSDRVVLEIGGRGARSPLQTEASSVPTIIESLAVGPDGTRPDLLHVLGRLWQAGARIDWPRLHAGERRYRISLPAYPFDRQRYWIDRNDGTPASDSGRQATAHKDASKWFHVPTWRRALRSRQSAAACLAARTRSWLVFRDSAGVGDALVKCLRQHAQPVVTVDTGTQFVQTAPRGYTIDPLRREDYERVLTDLRQSGGVPEMIVYGWSVDEADEVVANGMAPSDRPYRDFFALFHLARALAATTQASHEVCVVCRDVYDVIRTDTVSPLKSTIIGPCRVMPQECPGITCRIVDVEPARCGSNHALDLADTLIHEIVAEPAAPSVAYRGGVRWLQVFEPAPVPEGRVAAAPLRPRGVYLITGGLGAIGLTLGEHLATSLQARLILVSRSPIASSEWSCLESADAKDGMRAKRLRAIQASGADLLVCSADVADSAAMSRVVDEAYRRYGVVHGVIHAAGLVGDASFRTIREASVEDCRQQFRAKVQGLLCLYELLKDRDIEFWFLMSSLASILGGVGFSAYAAANAFLDAFATRQQHERTRWLSVNWDTWRFRERPAERPGPGTESAVYSLSPEQGVDIFQRSFHLADPQVVISTGDLGARLDQWVHLTSLKPAADATRKPRHARPRLLTPFVAPTRGLECAIAALWQDLLGIEAVGLHDDFFELGGQSLLAIQLMNRVRETCGVQLPVRQVFEARTVGELSRAVADGLAEQIDRRGLTSMVADAVHHVASADASAVKVSNE
jgi:acyl transferase domain-containing protein/acyl carrier protein